MHAATRSRTQIFATALVPAFLVALGAAGCKSDPNSPKNLPRPGQPDSVDNSWILAAESCWPDIRRSGRPPADLQRYLVDPAHFRSTFPSYAGLADPQIRANLTLPVATILPPDITRLAHSQTPVLTRGQAVAGTGPRDAVVASTDGSAPPDSFCSIQSGTPDGLQ